MSELTNDELRLAIAKARSEPTEHLPAQYMEWVTPDGTDGGSGFYCPRCHASEGDKGPCAPHYPTDLNAAWQLVDEAMRDCWSVNLNVNHLDNCTCTITTAGDVEYTAQAPTPARAIAEAWYQWWTAKAMDDPKFWGLKKWPKANLNNSRAVQLSRWAQGGDGEG